MSPLKISGEVVVVNKALKSVEGKHPWIFSGAVSSVSDGSGKGDIVNVLDRTGKFLGRGFYNPKSKIAVRMLTFDDQDINIEMFRDRLARSIAMRKAIVEHDRSDAWRLVYAESDFLPGLIVDKYANHLYVQFHSAGWEPIRSEIIDLLSELTGCTSIYDGSDTAMREKEGLPTENRVLFGEMPDEIVVTEFGIKQSVNLAHSQKSGLYLDQKFNHQRVADYAPGRSVLDCFSYTGGFSLVAVDVGCSSLTAIDISELAMQGLESNAILNDFAERDITLLTGDVFGILRGLIEDNKRYDMIILDPPAFCKSKNAIIKACRGYKDINRLAMQLLSSDGVLISCSCSRPISGELFRQVLWQASVEANREAQLVDFSGQSQDHPVLLAFPESRYLKCATMLVK